MDCDFLRDVLVYHSDSHEQNMFAAIMKTQGLRYSHKEIKNGLSSQYKFFKGVTRIDLIFKHIL